MDPDPNQYSQTFFHDLKLMEITSYSMFLSAAYDLLYFWSYWQKKLWCVPSPVRYTL